MSHGHHCMKSITPSDTERLTNHQGRPQSMEIYCAGNAGTITFMPNGNASCGAAPITLSILPRGVLPCEAVQVMATGTTATDLYGIWCFNNH